MNRRTSREWPARLIAVLAVATAIGCLSTCSAGEKETSDKFETIRTYVQTWLSETSSDRLMISSAHLKEAIVDDWSHQSDKYQIVSVRKPDDYKTAGYIPKATNIYWVDIMKDESFARLDSNKTVILYCYYGHGSMISLSILSLLGYRAHSLDFGMMDWNRDALVKDPWDQAADYQVETTVNRPKELYPAPVIASDKTDVKSIIKEIASKYLSGEGSPIIRSADVKALIDNWEQKKVEYQIIDVRPRKDYERGHVPKAINIPWKEIAEIENLRSLDPHRTVITCSDNGQIGQVAATVLNLLGYHAVNMLFGMMDWNQTHVDSLNLWDGVASYPIEHVNHLSPHGPDSR